MLATSDPGEYIVSVVVDTVPDGQSTVERLEVMVALTASTTAAAVVDDLTATLREKHLRLLAAMGEAEGCVLVWFDGGRRARLPRLKSYPTARAMLMACAATYAAALADPSTLVFSLRNAGATVLLDQPQIRRRLASTAAVQPHIDVFLTLLPTGATASAEDAAPTISHSPASLARAVDAAGAAPPSLLAPSGCAESEAEDDVKRAAWVAAHLLTRPETMMYGGRDGCGPVVSMRDAVDTAANFSSAQRDEARRHVEAAVQAELEGPLRDVFPSDCRDGGKGSSVELRRAWLSRCAVEAAAHEREAARLDGLTAQRVAWAEAANRKLRAEVAALESNAADGRAFVAQLATLEVRLRAVRRRAERAQAEEARLIAELHEQRMAAAATAATSTTALQLDAPTETSSPAPRPPQGPPPQQPLSASEAGDDAMPDASTIQRPMRGDGPRVGAADDDADAVSESEPFPLPTSPPPVSAMRQVAGAASGDSGGDGDSAAVTRLSFNSSSLAASPAALKSRGDAMACGTATTDAGRPSEHAGCETGHGEAHDRHTFFFTPALRTSVEAAVAARGAGPRTASPVAVRPRFSPSGIHVMSVRSGSDPEGPSLTDRLRMVTANVSRHVHGTGAAEDDTTAAEEEEERRQLLQTIHDLRRRIKREKAEEKTARI